MNESCESCEELRFQVGIAWAVPSSLSLLCCLFVIAILVIHKKYVFSTQRLMLYLSISVFLYTSGNLVQAVLVIRNETEGIACKVIAFTGHYASMSTLISISSLGLELLIGIMINKESGRRLNQLYFLAVFILPAFVCWIPFMYQAYGYNEFNCWIVDHENNMTLISGEILRVVLWWVPLYLSILFMVIVYIAIMCKLYFDKKKYTPMLELNRNEVYKNTFDDVMYLRYYPILYMIINIIPIFSHVYTSLHPNKHITLLWIATAIIDGIQGGFLTLVVTLDPKTRKRLTFKQIKAAFMYNILMRDIVEDYPIINSDVSDSLHPSNSRAVHTQPGREYQSC